jgi:hypothetical protein
MEKTLADWAKKWGLPKEALDELTSTPWLPQIVKSEVKDEWEVMQNARLAAGELGGVLFRNNVGVLMDKRGVPVRFGLANDSAALNKVIKSSDLIGYKTVAVKDLKQEFVAQFWALECKKPGWKYKGDSHEEAQLRFINKVRRDGGIADFVC